MVRGSGITLHALTQMLELGVPVIAGHSVVWRAYEPPSNVHPLTQSGLDGDGVYGALRTLSMIMIVPAPVPGDCYCNSATFIAPKKFQSLSEQDGSLRTAISQTAEGVTNCWVAGTEGCVKQ